MSGVHGSSFPILEIPQILLINSLFSLFVQAVLLWFLPLGTKNVGVSQVSVQGPSSLIHLLFLLK